MIRFITGKPGGGKGIVAMKEIIEELVNGDRPIITNFAVRIHPWVRVVRKMGKREYKPEMGLRHYLIKNHGKDFDCEKRIYILQPEDTKTFYLHRRNCESWIRCKESFDDKGSVVGFDTSLAVENGGVLYVIDEAWSVYGSRDWQTTGKGVLFYAAQHRKMGDTLLLVTQHTKQVETQLRQVAQDFAVVQNHSKKKLGWFRQPDLFSMAIYSEVPTGSEQEPMERRVFKLDKPGIGSCFDTAGGVGLGGGSSADIGEKIRGLPFPMIFLALAAIAVGFIFFAKGAGWLTGSFLTGAFGLKKETKQSVPASTNSGTINNFVASMLPKVKGPDTNQMLPRGNIASNWVPVFVTAVYPSAGMASLSISLSDGRRFFLGDGHCSSFNSNKGAVIDGELIPMQPVFNSYHFNQNAKSIFIK